ncbi:MAG TPA: phage terminase large subunit family protein, partial [Pirellulales bacterium]
MVAANGSNLANLKTTGLRKLLPEIAEVWRVEERPSLVDWSERTVRMPAETSAFPGPVDLRNRFPYAVGILEALDKPETQDATIMASSQIGKTITMLLAMLGLGQLSPSPAMLVTPDRPSMIEMRDRAYAMCDESPALA